VKRSVRHVLAAAALLLGMTAAPLAAQAADTPWPQFMFNTSHTGFNNLETTVTRQNVTSLSFEFGALGPTGNEFGNSFSHSAPAVVNGVMYLGTTNGELLAFSATGCGDDFCTPLWSAQLSNGVQVSPAVVNGVVYIESAGTEDGRLYAFKAAGCGQPTCTPLWSAVNHGNGGASPTVANGSIYTVSSDGHLYVFNANGCGQAECRPVWSAKIGTPAQFQSGSSEASAAVSGSVVYVAGSKQLFAFPAAGCSAAVCNPLWKSAVLTGEAESFLGSGPSVSGGRVFIASSDTSPDSFTRMMAFNAAGCGRATCAPQWTSRIAQNAFQVTPAVANGVVYAGATDGLFAFNAAGCGRSTCSPLWRGNPAGGIFFGTAASPAVASGVVYHMSNSGRMAAYDARGCGQASCAPIWEFVSQAGVLNTPVIVNGRLYVSGSNFGFTPEVYVFRPVLP
jgi:outer membrane protein assembly factor BamB